MKKPTLLSQKQIYSFISIAFFAMIFFSILSIFNLQHHLAKNREAQKHQEAAQKLIDAQNNLITYQTREAELFVMTHDLTHLRNFLSNGGEMLSIKTKINQLKKTSLPKYESKYWRIVEENTTLLYYTQLRAIKLTTTSLALKSEDLPHLVQNYQLNWTEQTLSPQAQQNKAQLLLFSTNYTDEQQIITHNIQRFRTAILSRLNQQTQVSKENTNLAIHIELLTQFLMLLIFLAILILFFSYVVHPIQHYTQSLESRDWTDDTPPLIPQGSAELHAFAKNFNQLYHQMITVTKLKSNFLSETSHELRTPLNAISGHIHLLKKTNLSEEQSQQLTIISQSSDHLIRMINNVLDFEKIEQRGLILNPIHFSLQRLFEEIIALHQPSATAKQINLSLDFAALSTDKVYADQERLRQVFINLINNAIKFTTDGFVCLKVREEFLAKLPTQNMYLKIQVIDNGIGIKTENLNRIFKAFEQIDDLPPSKSAGTGLGLPISQKIIEKMGGSITVKSIEAQGTTFTIHLKLEKSIQTMPHEVMFKPLLTEPSSKKILLVDDNLLNLQMTSNIIKHYGSNVVTAETGYKALEKLQTEDFDLILLDLRLPDISGIDIVKKLRQENGRHTKTKVIALTADVEKERLTLALAAGMDGYLAKPIDFDKLESLIFEKMSKDVQDRNFNHFRSVFFKDYLPQIRHMNRLSLPEREHLLHDLKGLSGNLKLQKIYQKTVEVEQLKHLNWLPHYIKLFEESAAYFKIDFEEKGRQKSEKPTLNAEVLAQLKIMVKNANPMAFELVKNYSVSQELEEALKNYNFLEASALLESFNLAAIP
ncbi:hypothetical protein RyT2_13070 [Pseudolactococcus yaeyamensis]